MKKRIIVFMLLFVFLVGVGVPEQVKAEDTTEDIKRFSNVNEYMDTLGLNLPHIDLKDGYSYLLEEDCNYYFLFEFEQCNYLYLFSDLLAVKSANKYVDIYTYKITKGRTDYCDVTWTLESQRNSDHFNSVLTILYSEYNVYSDKNYSGIYFSKNKYLPEIPVIPEDYFDSYENVICGRYSVMNLSNADKPFLIVGSGTPILKTDNRSISFMSESGGYTQDMDLYLVDDSGNWYLAYENLSSFGATDKTGYSVEYAPTITYTNKDIYFQDDSVTDVTASSEVWVSYEDFLEPYTFEQWCSDAGLNCVASSNETEDTFPFEFDQDNWYIVRKNRVSGSEYTWYLSEFKRYDSDTWHLYSKLRAMADNTLGIADLSVDYTMKSVPVSNYVYDSSGGGWLFVDRPGFILQPGENSIDDIGISFGSSMPIVFSNVDIYSDVEQSSVYYSASAEYVDSEVFYPDLSPTSTPTPTPISNSGSSELGGNVVAGGGIDFIISLVSLIWTRIYSIPMYVDGFQITLQQIYVYGILAVIVGAAIFGFSRRK